MEAAKPDSGSASERGRCGGTAVSPWVWTAVSSAESPVIHRTHGITWVRPGGSTCWSVIGTADDVGVCSGGCFPATEDSLDVVASDGRISHRLGRSGLSTSSGCRLRHY